MSSNYSKKAAIKGRSFKLKFLTKAVILACSAATSVTALSQETAALEQITVYGSFSGGLGKALDLKREAASISDAVIAEDIGKLPAVNIAEALQRVPGVSINREGGEGQFVSVRGLGPNFQSVTFNGSPIAFNENVRNSDQTGRQFRFRIIPADLIGGLVVAKAPTADLIDGGIGSNLDLRTVKPLDKDPFVSARLFANYDEQTSETSPNGSISAGWKNDAGNFGAIGGVSFQEREVRFDRLHTFSYDDQTIAGTDVLFGSLNATVEEEKRERVSFLGGLQWQPSDNLELSFDVLHSEFDNEIAENRISFDFAGFSGVDPASLVTRDTFVDGNAVPVVVALNTLDGARINRNAEFSAQSHENTFVNFKLDYQAGDWRISPSISYSEATSGLSTPLQRIDSRTSNSAGNGISIFQDLGSSPVSGIGINRLETNVDLLDPNSVPFRRYRIRPINSEDEDTTVLLDIERELDVDFAGVNLASVKFGGQYSDRSRDYQRRDRTLVARPGVTVDGSFYTTGIPSDSFSDIIANFTNGWVGPTLSTFADTFVGANGEFDNVRVQAGELTPTSSDLQRSYGVNEDVQALYGRFDFVSEFHGVPFSGNIGVRWVNTDSEVVGTFIVPGDDGAGGVTTVVVPTTFDSSYSEVLPSLNINFELQENVLLRMAVSKALTRPSLADLRTALVPNSAVTAEIFERGSAALLDPGLDDVTERTGTGGNPGLSPYVSNNVDASLEWYFDDFGAVTVSGFYKDISDFIGSSSGVETLLFPVDPALGEGTTLPVDFLISRAENLGDATITGVELSYTDRLENGFGWASSITFVNASLDNRGTTQELQGVSDVSYTISPFFEHERFEAHLNWTWRSAHNTNSNATIGSDAANNGFSPVNDDFGQLDFGASYQINDNFQVFVEGVNLTEERQASFINNETLFRQAQAYGRSFNFGIKGSF